MLRRFVSKSTRRTVMLAILLALASLVVSVRAETEELQVDQLFDPTKLIQVSIDIPAKDWDELRKQTRDPRRVFSGSIENPFTYFKGDITIEGVKIRSVGIRKKGFIGSLDDRWPSLKIKFDEYVKQSPISDLDGLTLNNNKQDSSLCSQFLAYRLFDAAAVRAPRCNFARVTVNGEDFGIYSNVESIGKPFLKRRFGKDSGNLYEGTLADFYPKALDRLEIKTNKQKHDLTKVARLAKLLADDQPLAIDKVEEVVDVENFLRFWAMESLIGFWDGYSNNQNNFWVYDNPANGKFYFMPWGADGAFMGMGAFPGFGPRGPVSVYAESMLANRLYNDKATAERYRETMRWLLANVWKEDELLKSIDQVERLVAGHLHERQKGVPRAMNTMRKFIRTRREAVEKELESWPVRIAAQPRKPMYVVKVGSASGSFSTKWAETPPANIAKTGSAKLELELDDHPVAFKQLGASMHRPRQGGFPFGFGGPGPQAQDQPSLNIVIAGVRELGGQPMTLTISIDPNVLSENVDKPVTVQGSIAMGEDRRGPFMPFGGRTVSGTVTFSKVGKIPGDAVEGEFDLTVSETHGGFMDRRGPGGGPGRGPGAERPESR